MLPKAKFFFIKNQNLNNKKGIAILLVMSTIAILSFLLADFTYKTQINQLKSINIEDRIQARLNAEAGLNFALAQLRIYQEALNRLASTKGASQIIKEYDLQSILALPMSFPFKSLSTNLIAKNALSEFNDSVLLKGEMNVSITPVSGFINVNSLALDLKSNQNSSNNTNSNFDNNSNNNFDGNSNNNFDGNNNDNQSTNNQKKIQTLIRKKLLTYIQDKLQSEMETLGSTEFEIKYGNPDAEKMITELQYYVTNKDKITSYEGPLEFSDAASLYSDAGIEAKHAPLTSMSELYLLQGWNDALIELVKDKLTVHQSNIIELNKLTKDQLILLFPNISKIQIEEFFKYRDGDEETNIKAQPFKQKSEFVNLIVDKLQIISKENFIDLEKDLKSMGLTFGVASNYYQIKANGRFNSSTYSIRAFVEIPLLELIQPKPKGTNSTKKRPPPKKVYLKPRVIEII